MADCFLLLHSGCGSHPSGTIDAQKLLLKQASITAMKQGDVLIPTANSAVNTALDDYKLCVHQLAHAMSFLEDSGLTNAGTGSCLNYQKTVQCEASMQCAQPIGLFAAVGSVEHVRNPIQLAGEVLLHQLEKPHLSCFRVPPSVLVGRGAEAFGQSRGLNLVTNENLQSPQTRWAYQRDKLRVHLTEARKYYLNQPIKRAARRRTLPGGRDDVVRDAATASDSPLYCMPGQNKGSTLDGVEEILVDVADAVEGTTAKCARPSTYDTIGGILITPNGPGLVACSSGGIPLKFDGRLGHSCSPGASTASVSDEEGNQVLACSTGVGEHLLRTLVCFRLATALLAEPSVDTCRRVFRSAFLEEGPAAYDYAKMGSVLCAYKHNAPRSAVEVFVVSNGPSLLFSTQVSGASPPEVFELHKNAATDRLEQIAVFNAVYPMKEVRNSSPQLSKELQMGQLEEAADRH